MSPDVISIPARGTTCTRMPAGLRSREVVVQCLEVGQRVDEIAQALGISSTTVRKWWRRHRPAKACRIGGSRPQRSPRQTRAR